jgi:hypothetical protein
MKAHVQAKKWWGQCTINVGDVSEWTIGPLSIWIKRFDGEWRLAYHLEIDSSLSKSSFNRGRDEDTLLSKENVLRFALSQKSNDILLSPILADRPVVVRPEKPLYVLQRDKVSVYVPSPLWVRVEIDQPLRQLAEIPSVRPSDTWFGPNTLEGELCYASNAFCRVRYEDIVFRPYRAITKVFIDNQSSTPLLLESINLPVTYLSLYHNSETDSLWTESIKLIREEGEKLNRVKLDASPPTQAGVCEKIQGARLRHDRNILTRAFKNLF